MQLSIDFDYNDFFAVPDIKISLDDLCLHHGKVNEHFEFDIDLEDGPHQLTIDHHGKKIDWTKSGKNTACFLVSLVVLESSNQKSKLLRYKKSF